jgi:rod shape-determining protein MreC
MFMAILLGGGVLRLYKPFYQKIEQGLFEGTARIQAVLSYPFYGANRVLSTTHTMMNLTEEYDRLSQENETLKWQLQAFHALAYENKVLKQNLGIPLENKSPRRLARILSSPYDGLHHFFLIAAGHQDNLTKDQPVIVKEGVVGRLEKVGKGISRVLLLNDANSRIPVLTVTSQQKAILAGDGTFFPTLVYVGDVRKIQPGEKVVTSGMGGIFPAGLPVGIVEKVTHNDIRIRPYAPFRDMEWVHILHVNSGEFEEEVKAALRSE